ncbi:AAA family ATPase [Yoonia sp.]|uniref:AAA family ATPase n=1 Tax=Yoonia sp. TaxID=2212373 RepID=UPI0019E68E5F|nr:AAA family ATPase [Yoonia sp.]MBE0413739.1 AAA family ATPase [Yoonia sp.]
MTAPNLYSSTDTGPRGLSAGVGPAPSPLLLPKSARKRDEHIHRRPDQPRPLPGVSTPPKGKDTPASAVADQDQPAQPQTGNAIATTAQNRLLPVQWAPPPGSLILVGRARGGIGATSFAVNLAIELCSKRATGRSRDRKKVALVDFDVQFGTVANSLDLTDRGGLVDLLRLPRHPDAQAVRNALLTHNSGLRVLAAPANPIPLDALDAPRVAAILDALMADNDTVIIDMPPALMRWIEPLLARAERMLVVTNLAVTSVTSARRMLNILREDAPNLTIETVVSRESKPILQGKLHRQAAETIGAPLSYWLPEDARNARLALDRGEPMVTFAPRSSWSRAVRRAAQTIHKSAARQQLQR